MGNYSYGPQYTALHLNGEIYAQYSNGDWGFRPDGSEDISLILWLWPDNPNGRLIDGDGVLTLDLMDNQLIFWLKGYLGKRNIDDAPAPVRWFDFETAAPREKDTGVLPEIEDGAQPYALGDGVFCGNDEGLHPLAGDIVNPVASQDAAYTVQAWISIYDRELNWGCVEAHTFIQMADGSEKMISQIEVGDRIFSPEHGSDQVSSIVKGVEPELFAIRAVGGRTLLLTGKLPVYTAAGVKTATELTPVNELILANGRRADIDALYTIQGDFQVYSLELEKGRCLICNGYQTGDLRLQGELMCGKHPAGAGPGEAGGGRGAGPLL